MFSSEGIVLEEQIIHLMLHHRDAVQAFAESPNKVDQFEERHQYLLEAILDAESRDALLTRVSFGIYLERLQLNKKATVQQIGLFARLRSTVTGVKPDDIGALLEKKRVAYIDARGIRLIDEFRTTRAKDPVLAVHELAEKLKGTLDEVNVSHNITFNDITSKEFYSQWRAEVIHKRESDTPLLLCGLPEIDEVMGTGFGDGTLIVICADVASFKSTLMLNIGLNLWQINKVDVLFVGLEMPKNRIFDKIISRETRIPFDYFQKPKNTLKDEDLERVDAKVAELEGLSHKFVLLEFGERTSVGAIKRQIQKHINIHKPRLVVVDYIANLTPDERRRDGRNDLEIGDMLKELRVMGTAGVITPLGFSVLTGAQLGREAIKRLRNQRDQAKMALGSEDIQGSHQYSADATSIFGLYKNPSDPSQIIVFPMKNRYGKVVYESGGNKAVLHVKPEISLIYSKTKATWDSNAEESVLKMSANIVAPTNPFDLGFDDEPEPKKKSAFVDIGTPDDLLSM